MKGVLAENTYHCSKRQESELTRHQSQDHFNPEFMKNGAESSAVLSDFRGYVRSQLTNIILPHAEKWEEQGKVAYRDWMKLAREGLFSFDHTGEGFLRSAIFLEEVGRLGYSGIRASIGVHAYMARSYLERFGTEEQKEIYLPGIRSGELIGALAISEADAGSDLRHLGTRAEMVDGRFYKVSGEKLYVTNGTGASFFIVVANTRQKPAASGLTGMGVFIVDGKSQGIYRHPQAMLGWRSADLCRIEFDEVNVPLSRLLCRPDRALIQLMEALDFERLVAGLLAVGGIGYCLEQLHSFVHKHRVRDTPLGANRAIQHQIAELDCGYELVRQYAYHAARVQSDGRLDTRTASILKLKATELEVTAAEKCVQYHGARGYLMDSTSARLYRDAMGGTIAGGASELLREMIYELTPP
ncbi:MAG: acyl-CoA dehydrogenase family protein [Streptosporangiaceae bacterium]|jgi:alkylation response protein AidB-like acyl-CoA dehydrogenase